MEINEDKVNDKEVKQIHGRIIRSEREEKKQYGLTERYTVFHRCSLAQHEAR